MKNSIKIKNLKTDTSSSIQIEEYYKIFCRKKVSKCYYRYKSYFLASGTDITDLRQEIYLMLWQILTKNNKTKEISEDNLGGYLNNATQWQLNNLVHKAKAIYKMHLLNIDEINLNKIEEKTPPNKSEEILDMFKNNQDLLNTIKEICTEKESSAIIDYYFDNRNTIEISKKMEVSPQRISALINEGLLKLNHYFTQFTKRSKDE
jgi:RNA polymerase sigma factor (sigma-70 family)